jgi:hypothetical protein
MRQEKASGITGVEVSSVPLFKTLFQRLNLETDVTSVTSKALMSLEGGTMFFREPKNDLYGDQNFQVVANRDSSFGSVSYWQIIQRQE